MRHIQIKLSLILVMILLSVSGYGQIQQVLKNGFVAATNDGVWYLQDRDKEWVRFKDAVSMNGKVLITPFDTINGISYNNNKLCISGFSESFGTTLGEFNDGNYNSLVFNNSFSDIFNFAFSADRTNDSGKTFNRSFCIDFPILIYSVLVDESSKTYSTISQYSTSNFKSLTNNDYVATDIDIGDNTVVIVGKNNKMQKISVNTTTISSSTDIMVSGLHSRSIDSHKICYNPDEDVFIIVSDSGIVYSYDKTSITTLDTISSINGGHLTGVYDLVYDDIFDRYYISFLDSDGFYDVQSFTTPIDAINGNTNIISPSNPYSLSINSKGDILALSKNICYKIERNHGGAIEINNIGGDIVVFDLDYINYLP